MKYLAGEWGIGLRHNAARDLTAVTSVELTVTNPDGVTFVVDGAEVGAVDSYSKKYKKIFKANEYGLYVTKQGEFDLLGRYYLQWEFNFGTGRRSKPELQLLDVES